MKRQFRVRLNDRRSLVLACGLKKQLVNSLGVPGSLVSWNQEPFIGPSFGNNLRSIAFCIWRLVYVTRMTLLCVLHLLSTEIVAARAKMAVACVLGGCNSMARAALLYSLWK